MKDKNQFLEANGYYWIRVKGKDNDPEIAQYNGFPKNFREISECEVLSDIILRPTE